MRRLIVMKVRDVPFNKIDESFIFANRPTAKQKAFLDEYTDGNNDNICGYHALSCL